MIITESKRFFIILLIRRVIIAYNFKNSMAKRIRGNTIAFKPKLFLNLVLI